MMIFFSLMAILSALKMRKYHGHPFSFGWWIWLISAAVNMGLAFSVKYLAFYSCSLCLALLLRDFWVRRLGDRNASNMKVLSEFCVQATVLAIIPFAIYVSLFYVHLSILTKAGHHDSLMTSAFQASLEGGLSSIVRGQPLAVAHGSQITLRHTHGRTCWMHSHEHVYPIREYFDVVLKSSTLVYFLWPYRVSGW
jgi:dolichyl-phosphate-mannose-protein mannosyltransferase